MPIVVSKGIASLVVLFLGLSGGVLYIGELSNVEFTITGHQGSSFWGVLSVGGKEESVKVEIIEDDDITSHDVQNPGSVRITFHKKEGEVKVDYQREMGAGEMTDADIEHVNRILQEINNYLDKLEPKERIVENIVEVPKDSSFKRFLNWVNQYRYVKE